MNNDPPKRLPEADADLERQIRAERKFSLAEAIGRMAGPGAMKGASPVTRKAQAGAVIEDYLRRHLSDAGGVLVGVVLRHASESDQLLADYDRPLAALAGYARQVLGSEFQLKELVREADAEWGVDDPSGRGGGRPTRMTRTRPNRCGPAYRGCWRRSTPARRSPRRSTDRAECN